MQNMWFIFYANVKWFSAYGMNVKYASILINVMHTTIRKNIEQAKSDFIALTLEVITSSVSNKGRAKRKAKVFYISYLIGGSVSESPTTYKSYQ